MIARLIIFLIINFGALAIGSFFTSKGVPSDWYVQLNKAPWTPPGWAFGLAWTIIMICFSIYMAYLWPTAHSKTTFIILVTLQWVLNVSWNPVFFYYHNTMVGMIIISALTIIIGILMVKYWSDIRLKTLLILPYLIWLIIASSLNGYIMIKN
jgi:tryptophan-rich sensory protein